MFNLKLLTTTIGLMMLFALLSLSGPAFAQTPTEVRDAQGQDLLDAFDNSYTTDISMTRNTLNQIRQRAQATNDIELKLAYVDRVLSVSHSRYTENTELIIETIESWQGERNDALSREQAAFLQMAIAALNVQQKTNLDQAEKTLLALHNNPKAETFQAIVKRELGHLYQSLGQYPRAIVFYTDALRLDATATFQANIYNNLGNTTGYFEDWDQSVVYYQRAIQLYESVGRDIDVLLVQANLGATYRAANRTQEALTLYQAGLDALTSTEVPDLEAQFQMNLGNLYVELGEVQSGLDALRKSLAICLKEGLSYCVMLSRLNVGHAHLVNGDFDQALVFFDRTNEDLESLDDPYVERSLMDNYADVYREQGDHERALLYFDRYHALDRQLISAEAKAAAEETQTRYETELKDAELTVQAEQIERQRAQIQIGIVLAAGVGAVLAVVIFFLSFRARTLQSLYERNQDLLRQNEVNQRLNERQSADLQQANTNPLAPDGTSPSLEHVFERVTSALQQEGIYRDANLSLGDLAAHVASNSTYVSNAISQFANTNFNNLVNYYRIMDARRQLNQAGASTSIAQLAQGCGFNSKASFYRAFSKYVGMTPSQYCQRLKANRTDAA
jgi:AraC-like DNA-binding protein